MDEASKTLAACEHLLLQLADSPERDIWADALQALIDIGHLDLTRLDAKILMSTLRDMYAGYHSFCPHRHTRKVTVFGSARSPEDSAEYQQAVDFARCITQQGFAVMTGGRWWHYACW